MRTLTSLAAMQVLAGEMQSSNTDLGKITGASKGVITAIKYDMAATSLEAMSYFRLTVAPEIRSALLVDIEAGGISRFSPILQIALGTIGLDEESGKYAGVGTFEELNILPVSHIKDTEWKPNPQTGVLEKPTYQGSRVMPLTQKAYEELNPNSGFVFSGKSEKVKSLNVAGFYKAIEGMGEVELREVFQKGFIEVDGVKHYTPREISIRTLESLLEQAEKNGAVIAANIQFESERIMTMIGSYVDEPSTSDIKRFVSETLLTDNAGREIVITEDAINNDPRLTRFFDGNRISGFDDIRKMMSSTYKNPTKTNILDPNQSIYRSKVARLSELGKSFMSAGFMDDYYKELSDEGLSAIDQMDITNRTLYSAAAMLTRGKVTEIIEDSLKNGEIEGFLDNGTTRYVGMSRSTKSAVIKDTFSMSSVQYNLSVLFGKTQAHTALEDIKDQLMVLNKVNPVARFLGENARLYMRGGAVNNMLGFIRETAAVLNPSSRKEIEDVWQLFAGRSAVATTTDTITGKVLRGPLLNVMKYRAIQRAMFQLEESMKVWTATDLDSIESPLITNRIKNDLGKTVAVELDEGFTLTQNKVNIKELVRKDGKTSTEVRTVGRDYTLAERANLFYLLGLEDLKDKGRLQGKNERSLRQAAAREYAARMIREEYLNTPSMRNSGYTLDDLNQIAEEIRNKSNLVKDGQNVGLRSVHYNLISGKKKIESQLIEKTLEENRKLSSEGKITSELLGTYTSSYLERHKGKIIATTLGAIGLSVAAVDAGYEWITGDGYDPTRVSTLDLVKPRSELNPWVTQSTEANDNSNPYEVTRGSQIPYYLESGYRALKQNLAPNYGSQKLINDYSGPGAAISNMTENAPSQGINLSKFDIDVSDADTLKITSVNNPNEYFRVRLAGIDSPETRHSKSGLIIGEGNMGQPMANESANYMKNLILSTKDVKLNVEAKDDYGRLTGVLSSGNGTNLNLATVQAGMAQALPWGPQKADSIIQKDFLYSEKLAQQSESGIHNLPYYQRYYESLESRFSKRTFNVLSQIQPNRDSRNNPALFAAINVGTKEQAGRFKKARKQDYRLNQEVFNELFGNGGDSRQLEALGHQGIAWQIRQQMTDFGSGYRGINGSLFKQVTNIFDKGFEQSPGHRIWYQKDHLAIVQRISDDLLRMKGGDKFISDHLVWMHDLPKALNMDKDHSVSFSLLKEAYGDKIASQITRNLEEVDNIKEMSPLELMKLSPDVKNVSTADAMSHYSTGEGGFLQIFMNEKGHSLKLEEVIQSNIKKLAKDQKKIQYQEYNLDDVTFDYGKNNRITVQGNVPDIVTAKYMGNRNEVMRDNTYLTLAGTMQRNPGRNRRRRS